MQLIYIVMRRCFTTPYKDSLKRNQKTRLINELDIYNLIFNSELPEAKTFKKWVFDLIKSLREKTDLEGYQIFSMTDKQLQKDAMAKIKDVKPNVSRFDYINANKIANEAVRIVYSLDKSIKKDGFNLEQMETRQVALSIITSVTELKARNDSNINVRNTILSMFTAKEA